MKPNTEIKDRFHITEDKKQSLLPKTRKKKKKLETQMYRIVVWTLWERERVGQFGRMALKHV